MPVTVVLAVGLDSWLISLHNELWKSQGFVMIPVSSVSEAIDHFKTGDFDLVLMGDSLPVEQQERLTSLIRSRGARTPIVCVSDSTAACEPDTTVESRDNGDFRSDPGTLISGLKELLEAQTKPLARPRALWGHVM
jgi:DNA-binding response OmpR family regulator